MVWLLQLANLQCPCLGLTSNELRELLFSCIKGTIREASQFLPPMERYLPGIFNLPCDCPPTACTVPRGVGAPLESWDLKTWAEEKTRIRLLQSPEAEGAQRVASNLCVYHYSSHPTCLPCPINPSPLPKQLSSFVTTPHWALLIIISFLKEWLYLEVL